MNKQYTYIENQYPARPRSKRRREMGEGNAGGGTTVVAGGGTGSEGTGSVTSHSQLSGIVSTDDEYSEFANDIHLTATDADALKRLSKFEIIESTELDTKIPSDENLYSALATDFRITEELEDFLEDINEMFLRKDINDTAYGIISFDQKIGSSVFLEGYEGKGWEIKETGAALFDSAQVRSDILMGGKIGSPSFASGFTGWGWEIDTPTASGTVDNWTVRKSMKVYEMVYSQVYGLNSSFLVSEWNKIKSVTPLGSNRYRCEIDDMEGEMFVNLRNGDIVRTQKRDGWNIRYFASEVENVTGESFDLKVIEGIDYPQPGDYVQRIGSKVDRNRQGLIYFTSSDDYAPYIDILDEVTGAQFGENNTKVRIGNLRGIRINGQPLDMHGIYINGGIFQHSTYYMEDGNTIEQHFSIMDGKLTSEIEGVRNDISGEKGNILRNSSFASNLNYWTTADNVHFIPIAGGFMWLPSAFYVDKKAVSDIYRDGSRNVLRIRNNSLTQVNGVLNLPEHSEASEDGLYTYSFSFHYKVLRAGMLTAGVKDTELHTAQSLTESEEYQLLFHEGMWNERGDFELSFTGEILIYGATLRNDTSADAFIYMKTAIEQSEEKIRLWATKEVKDLEGRIYIKYDGELKVTAEQISAVNTRVDNVNNRINTAGWITTADSVNIFAQELNKTGIKNSIANLQVKYNEISSTVSENVQDIINARNLANSAANQAVRAMGGGIYGQEQYSQSSNPWNSWQSGTEYKHVGALWYNPSSGVTKRYTGTDGSNSWETVSNSSISAASFVLQNKDKWSLVVANFDSNGNPTNASGIVTTAYGNTLWASKNGIISAINQSPESISIDASKINLNGVVTANRTFTIETDGTFRASAGTIGRFNIVNNRLVWNQSNYVGGISRELKLGYSKGNEGVVDISFDASTDGKFGVKAIGRAPGSAAIYGSSQPSPAYPTGSTVWAGWFDGYINTKGYFINGKGGVNWNQTTGSPDLDHIRLIVEGGIIIGYYKE